MFGLARLLEVIEEFESRKGRDPYTRELLGYLRMWGGYGEDLLLLAWNLGGLVERYDDYCDPRTRGFVGLIGLVEGGVVSF